MLFQGGYFIGYFLVKIQGINCLCAVRIDDRQHAAGICVLVAPVAGRNFHCNSLTGIVPQPLILIGAGAIEINGVGTIHDLKVGIELCFHKLYTSSAANSASVRTPSKLAVEYS